jgi:ADP-ribose pyrophosphatase
MMDKQLVFKGKIIEVEVQLVTLPNGHQMEMEVVRHPGGAAVAAVNDRHEICLLKQYRCVFNEWLWELPAGKRDHQEPPLATAQRELAEEAGVIAGQWTELGSMISSPGVFTERVYLYLARQLSATTSHAAQDEVFQVHWISLGEALRWVMKGDISDAKSAIAILKTSQLLDNGKL